MTQRIPAEVFPPSAYLKEEMLARGWTEEDLHDQIFRTGGTDIDCCAVDFCLHVDDKNLILDAKTAEALARAFGTSPEFWINLDCEWRGVSILEQSAKEQEGRD